MIVRASSVRIKEVTNWFRFGPDMATEATAQVVLTLDEPTAEVLERIRLIQACGEGLVVFFEHAQIAFDDALEEALAKQGGKEE